MKRVALYVPTVDNEGTLIESYLRKTVLDEVVSTFVRNFGGCSENELKGTYRTHLGRGGIISENVTEVHSFLPDEMGFEAKVHITELAKWVATMLKQESVLVTVQDVASVDFITP